MLMMERTKNVLLVSQDTLPSFTIHNSIGFSLLIQTSTIRSLIVLLSLIVKLTAPMSTDVPSVLQMPQELNTPMIQSYIRIALK